MRILMTTIALAALLTVTGDAVLAQSDYPAQLLGTGHEEREDAGGTCLSETAFVAGVHDAVTQLQVGGDSAGCDAEWGACAEFDFAAIGTGNPILGATLHLRYTGYGDDAAGLPYVGLFAYAYTALPVVLPRADLNDQTALAIFAPTGTTNVDFSFDVTDHVIDLVAENIFQASFFVCGVFSEVGYNDLVYFGGASHANPPRLVVTTLQPVPVESRSWGRVKALYR
ncbi:MAG: hypothetical protein GY838_05165 [bacterium]|nr:hypothetical protein [bacterium]